MNVPNRLIFDQNIDQAMKMASHILRDFTPSALSLMRVAAHQRKAKAKRAALLAEEIMIPPLLIVSTTQRCNLHCKGCYAQALCHDEKSEMTQGQIQTLLTQAEDAGCSLIMLAGGEPLLCPNWLEGVAGHPNLLGLVFTNGTLIDEAQVAWFAKHRNMIPLFSIEGDDTSTDHRRGMGVSAHIGQAMQALHNVRVPFGVSLTTGEHNMDVVTSASFLDPYYQLGCRLFLHVEYVPVDEQTELLVLTQESKMRLALYCDRQTEQGNALFIAFPGDETVFDGCLAAGRGFVHISASGALEPCPFAPYSDQNVCETSLLEALQSPLLGAIRKESNRLHEGMGGCALRNQGEWITHLLQ